MDCLRNEKHSVLNCVPRFEDDAENEQLQSHSKARERHKNTPALVQLGPVQTSHFCRVEFNAN